jgi:hypothetical protein
MAAGEQQQILRLGERRHEPEEAGHDHRRADAVPRLELPNPSPGTSLGHSVGAEPSPRDQVSTYLPALPAKTPTNHHPSHWVPGWVTITNSATLEA